MFPLRRLLGVPSVFVANFLLTDGVLAVQNIKLKAENENQGQYTHNSLIRYQTQNVPCATKSTAAASEDDQAPNVVVCCCFYSDAASDGKLTDKSRVITGDSRALFDDEDFEGDEEGSCAGGYRVTVLDRDNGVSLLPKANLVLEQPVHSFQGADKGEGLNKYCRQSFCPVKDGNRNVLAEVESDDAAFANVAAVSSTATTTVAPTSELLVTRRGARRFLGMGQLQASASQTPTASTKKILRRDYVMTVATYVEPQSGQSTTLI